MGKIINYQGSMDKLVWHKEKRNLCSDDEVIVPMAHEAIFVKNGAMSESFSCGRHLFSENIGKGHLFEDKDEKIDCTVYYVKKEGSYNIKWSTPAPISVIDPMLKIHVEFNVSGVFAVRIIDSKQFLAQLLTFTQKVGLDEVKVFFRERMLLYIKDHLAAVMAEEKVSVVDLTNKLMTVSKALELKMRYSCESFGVIIEGLMLKHASLVNAFAPDDPKILNKIYSSISDNADAQGGEEQKIEKPKAEQEKPEGEVMYCPSCGATLPPLSNFCFKCGVKLNK